MDCEKIGALIRTLRREQGMTQRELGEALHISDRTVSKWERGLGCPDVSLLPALSARLGVALEGMLSGIRTYPEWELQVRIPRRGHGKLLHYCTEHGLFYQLL